MNNQLTVLQALAVPAALMLIPIGLALAWPALRPPDAAAVVLMTDPMVIANTTGRTLAEARTMTQRVAAVQQLQGPVLVMLACTIIKG